MERPVGFSANSRAIVHVWFASWAAFFHSRKSSSAAQDGLVGHGASIVLSAGGAYVEAGSRLVR